ncbi:MAG: ABC transporter ATP-binding protein [Spirochaetaceae bacterium]|jgi:iron complex transport system ATP-binding protein|nr:ABC transporter ATP-binding protein [Spirochaetaceae bacterium]
MIKVYDASFYYHKGRELFSGLSFELPERETLAILGANGAGKTSLLRCLMRFLKFKKGSAFFGGADLGSIREDEFWRKVSYVPQAKACVFGHTCLNMVIMGRSPYIGTGRRPKQADVDAALTTMRSLGLENIASRPVSSLSGGELQMALIARALVKDPEILIMDEPESNLDLRNQLRVLELIEKLRAERNITIVVNTHFPGHALRIADRTLFLGSEGHVYGKTVEAVNEANIRKFYGVDSVILSVDAPAFNVPAVVPMGICEKKFFWRRYEKAV